MKRGMDRFWERVDKTETCWLWTGAKIATGYGHAWVPERGAAVVAHRVAYEALVGPVPEGLELDHLCRNRACVRPDHMEPVTHVENCRRGFLGGSNARLTHCKHGHEFTPENTYRYRTGRKCRTCHRLAERQRKAAA